MQAPQAALLPDGRRLHLQHGPIDLIVEASGPDRAAAYARAAKRFRTILQELVDDLESLRRPCTPARKPLASGLTRFRNLVLRRFETPCAPADRMCAATRPFAPDFVTPMAAVAGAVADEILAQITEDPGIAKAYVNNGGDIAFHLSGAETLTAAIATAPPATLTLNADQPARGIATSGWRGRSHSLGIADSVTVLAASAAAADAAATMIANAVDLPGDPRVTRRPACALSPDSDLGARLVTTDVAPLDPESRAAALDAGLARAAAYHGRGLIHAAYLTLQGDTRALGPALQHRTREHA